MSEPTAELNASRLGEMAAELRVMEDNVRTRSWTTHLATGRLLALPAGILSGFGAASQLLDALSSLVRAMDEP